MIHKKTIVRTYADSGRIAISTIQKVAIEHLISGNTAFALKALKELHKAIQDNYSKQIQDYNTLIKIAQNDTMSTDQIKSQLIKNNIKYRTR